MGFVATHPRGDASAPAGRERRASPRCLNLGCGGRFHPAWTNLDAHPIDPRVMRHDVTQGIPFADGSFEFVYHSHLLEHLAPEQGLQLLRECHRVLVPGGVIRVAVPDLEQIARLYLEALDKARAGDGRWQHHYDWMLIELLDQTVRETTGGRHGSYLNRDDIPNVEFVLMRHGREAQASIDGQRQLRAAAHFSPAAGGGNGATPSIIRRAARRGRRLASTLLRPARLREVALNRLLGADRELLELGRFRRSGEIHQWMYDSYSLSRALTDSGFETPARMRPSESHLEGWDRLGLDVDDEGRVHKPDSVFVEATRPQPRPATSSETDA